MKYLPACLSWLPAIGWYLLIWFFSAQTATVSGSLSDRLLYRLLERWGASFRLETLAGQTAIVEFLSFYLRKAAHMFLYFVLTALLTLALLCTLRLLGRRVVLWKQGALTVLLCAALAALDELHQTFVPGRSGEVRDLLVDLAGAVCFLLLLWIVRRVWLSYRPALPGRYPIR